jgi:DnaJ-class molecular chaperone
MAEQKRDYYQVLGVAKTASLEDIKSAFKKIAMKNHPDMLRNKTDAEKEEASRIFQEAKEAHEVLTDSQKRATYDRLGHQGLKNDTGSSTPGYKDAVGETTVRKPATVDDLDDFFTRRSGGVSTGPSTDQYTEMTADQRREERRRLREESRGRTSTPTTPADDFRDAAEEVTETVDRIGKSSAVSVEDLEAIRDALRVCLQKVDAVIARNPKNNPGPRP